MSEDKILENLTKAVIDHDEELAKKVAEEAVESGIDPLKAVKEGLQKGMAIIGEKFRKYEVFLPHVMLAAEALKAGMEVLEPRIAADKQSEASLGKVVMGTARGDIHDIGKNLVVTMLKVGGFEVHDLGIDVDNIKFVEKAEETGANMIAVSALLTASMAFQEDLIGYLKDANLRDRFFVIVGGGPVNPEWTKRIGADGYGRLADDGVEVCTKLVSEKENIKPPLSEPICIGG